MTWGFPYGTPWGGDDNPLPTPQLDDLTVNTASSGDIIVLTGSGFIPGTQVILDPEGIVIGSSSPTDVTSITITIPYGIPNTLHKIYVTNGNASNRIDLFILGSANFYTFAGGSPTEITLIGVN